MYYRLQKQLNQRICDIVCIAPRPSVMFANTIYLYEVAISAFAIIFLVLVHTTNIYQSLLGEISKKIPVWLGNVIGLGKNMAHPSFLWSSFIPYGLLLYPIGWWKKIKI